MNLGRGKAGWIAGLLALVALADYLWISPANQTYAKRYLNESIVLSASTYATCRVINGGVSSLQESSITISPWGVGLEYEAGQILDPINDAVERLSEACVHSMALLGAQRIVLGMINRFGMVPFYLSLVVFLGLLLLGRGYRFARLAGRIAILLLLLRVSTPALCFMGTLLNEQYFDPRIAEQSEQLGRIHELAWSEFETEVPEVLPSAKKEPGTLFPFTDFFRQIGQKVEWYSEWMKERASALSESLSYLRNNFTQIMDSLTALFVLVIEKIILLAILLPLGLLYLLRKAYRWLAEEELDVWLGSLLDDVPVKNKEASP